MTESPHLPAPVDERGLSVSEREERRALHRRQNRTAGKAAAYAGFSLALMRISYGEFFSGVVRSTEALALDGLLTGGFLALVVYFMTLGQLRLASEREREKREREERERAE